jgi:hypothetical protein
MDLYTDQERHRIVLGYQKLDLLQGTSMDHHYLPQFYLRQWVTEPDGRLWRYKLEPSGVVSERRVAPRGTAFEPDLYAVRDAGPLFQQPDPHIVETQFFQQVDDRAANVLTKLLAGSVRDLNTEEMAAWAIFLNSLLERHGSKLAARDKRSPELADEVYQAFVARCPSTGGRARLETYLKNVDRDQLSRNMVREHMVKEIKSQELVDYFVSRRWLVVTIRPEDFLITTDAPVVINCGKHAEPIVLLTVALSPEKLFIMYPPTWNMDAELVAHLSLLHNSMLLMARPSFVYSQRKVDRSELEQSMG